MIRSGLVLLFATVALAGCSPGGPPPGGSGGGSGGSLEVFPPSGDAPPGDPALVAGTQADAALLLLAFEGDGTVRDATGSVALSTGAVSGADLAGQLDAARTRIDLSAGGVLVLENLAGTEYVRQATATTAGASYFGVLGIPSLPTDLPASGGVSYTGRAVLQAVDSFDRYDLTGAALVNADFGAGRVRMELSDVGGTRQGISGTSVAPEAIAPVGRIVIADSVISGAGFEGGRASSTGLPFFLSRDASAAGTRGAFFGPGADEVGGRIAVDDPQGDVRVQGSFVAE
jgi:hypothetical protein